MDNLVYFLSTSEIDLETLSFLVTFVMDNFYKIILTIVLLFIILILEIVVIFKKAKQPIWKAFIPLYNSVILFKLVDMSWINVILMFIPLANIYVLGVLNVELAHKFGKGTLFGILSIFFSPITYGILAFGNSKYEDDSYRHIEHNHDLGFEKVSSYTPPKEEEKLEEVPKEPVVFDPNNLAVLEGTIPYPDSDNQNVESSDPVIVNDYNIGPIKQEDYAKPGSYRSRNANEVLSQVAAAEKMVAEQKAAKEKAAAFDINAFENNKQKTKVKPAPVIEVESVIPEIKVEIPEAPKGENIPEEKVEEKHFEARKITPQPIIIVDEDDFELQEKQQEKVKQEAVLKESIVEGRIVDEVTMATLDTKPEISNVDKISEVVEQKEVFIVPDVDAAVESYQSSLEQHFAHSEPPSVNTNIGNKMCPKCNSRLAGNATTCFLCGTKLD